MDSKIKVILWPMAGEELRSYLSVHSQVGLLFPNVAPAFPGSGLAVQGEGVWRSWNRGALGVPRAGGSSECTVTLGCGSEPFAPRCRRGWAGPDGPGMRPTSPPALASCPSHFTGGKCVTLIVIRALYTEGSVYGLTLSHHHRKTCSKLRGAPISSCAGLRNSAAILG